MCKFKRINFKSDIESIRLKKENELVDNSKHIKPAAIWKSVLTPQIQTIYLKQSNNWFYKLKNIK